MPGKHRLYMHCPGLSEDQLYLYLQQFGRVTDVYLPKNLDGSSKGYGFASFEAAEALNAALAAGDEHSIGGKTVRVNRAGPRPAPHMGARPDAVRLPAQPTTSEPSLGDISRQRGGHTMAALAGTTPVPPDTVLEAQGSSQAGRSRSGVPQGAGPRIYVGGIPNAVSETMVRNYFSNWGKVEDVYFPKERSSGRRRPFCFVTFASQKAAEKAVAQSNREISGYQVASISMTADRIAHYQQVAGGQEPQPAPEAFDQPAAAPAINYEALMPRFNTGMSLPGGLPASGTDRQFPNNQALLSFAQEATPGPLGLGGQFSYSLDDLSALHPSLLGRALQGQASLQPSLQPPQPPLLPGPQQALLAAQQGTVQSQLHEALLAHMAQADPANPVCYPFTYQGNQAANPLTFGNANQLHAFMQQRQQGLSPAPAQTGMGEQGLDPRPGLLGRISSMPEAINAAHVGLPLLPQQQTLAPQQRLNMASAMGQQPMQVAAHEQQQQQRQLNPQDTLMSIFDPTVRRPGQNFSEASPVFQDPQVEPHLSQQILVFNPAYGPRRGSPHFRTPRSVPY